MLKTFRFWFVVFVVSYSLYDYIEHISRAESVFQEHPFWWAAFCAAAVASLFSITYGFEWLMQRPSGRASVLFEVAGLAVWLALYLYVLGDAFDALLWPYGDLMFRLQPGPFLLVVAGYALLRLALELLVLKNPRLER
jgi:hypothetical protein